MKHVAIHAYPFGNVGDDLFIQTLCNRYAHVHFHLAMDPTYSNGLTAIPNLTIYSTRTIASRLRTRWGKKGPFPPSVWEQIEATIYIGGSLFMEQHGWEKPFNQMKQMKKDGCPFFIIGANFGPCYSERFIDTYEEWFADVTDICFRDRYSYRLFAHLPNVRYAPDVIFQTYDPFALGEQTNNRHLLISVIYPSVRKHLTHVDASYFSALANMATEAIQHHSAVTLTAFCTYEKDDQAMEEILKRMPKKERNKVQQHVYDGDLDEVSRVFQQATHIVATRFHAMILGWLFKKRVLPITYSQKMNRVLEDLSYTGNVQLIEEMDHTISSRIRTQKPVSFSIQTVADEAEEHFQEIDAFLIEE